jgi:hypothetical protein
MLGKLAAAGAAAVGASLATAAPAAADNGDDLAWDNSNGGTERMAFTGEIFPLRHRGPRRLWATAALDQALR